MIKPVISNIHSLFTTLAPLVELGLTWSSVQPPAPDEFEVRNDGTIRLLKRLNYNIARVHNFTVKAAVNINNMITKVTGSGTSHKLHDGPVTMI